MSEACKIYFLNVENEGDAFIKANLISKKIKECAEEYILDNKYTIPSRKDILVVKEQDKYTSRLSKEADELWLYALFNHKFIYWKKFNVLGLVGFSYPKDVENMFDLAHEFQNYCDVDYDLETWGFEDNIKDSPIPFFNEIIKEFLDFYSKINEDISIANSLLDNYKWINEYSLDRMEEYFNDNMLEYWLLSSIYNAIESALLVMRIIYNEENEDCYTLFSMNSLMGQSNAYKLIPFVRKAINEIDRENEAFLNSLKKGSE